MCVLAMFLLDIPMVTKVGHRVRNSNNACALDLFRTFLLKGGVYIFQLMDYYSASGMSMLFLVFFQTISIAWIFGTSRFCDCIEQMSGRRPSWFFYICWSFFGPLVMAVRQLLLYRKFTLNSYDILNINFHFCINTSNATGCLLILRNPIHPCIIWRKLPISLVG